MIREETELQLKRWRTVRGIRDLLNACLLIATFLSTADQTIRAIAVAGYLVAGYVGFMVRYSTWMILTDIDDKTEMQEKVGKP